MRRLAPLALLFAACAAPPEAVPEPAPPAPATPAPAGVVPNPVAVELAKGLAAAGVTVVPDDPATCEACHAAIVTEWRESMHARAHHESDPIFGAMRAMRAQREGAQITARCNACHQPRDLEEKAPAVARTGVSCATCHELAEVHLGTGRSLGAGALVRAEPGTLRAARDVPPGASPVHATGAALPALADGTTLCLACHGREENPAGVPTCTTGEELAASKGPESCVSCHMPELPTPAGAVATKATHRSHAFLGPHRAWLQDDPSHFRSALALQGAFAGERFTLTATNLSRHSFPSGFPARMAVLVLRGLDASGAEVWRNVKAEPMKEHPEAVWNKGYVDADGKPALAPFATKLVRDTRLKPDEARTLEVTLPPSVTTVEATLRYFLVAPMAAEKMGVAALPEAKPREVLRQSFTR